MIGHSTKGTNNTKYKFVDGENEHTFETLIMREKFDNFDEIRY